VSTTSSIPQIEVKKSTMTPEESMRAMEVAEKALTARGVDVKALKQEAIDEWMFKAIAKEERLWRHAVPHMRERFKAHAMVSSKDTVRAALAVLVDGQWPSLDECIPPGSILHDIDAMIYQGTNFPRELAFFNTFHYFSALLLQNGTVIQPPEHLETGPWLPDLWSVALAESGSGKTATSKVVAEIFGNSVRTLPDPGSAAMFVELLSQNNGALWARDEFGEFLRNLDGKGPWAAGKDFLLRTYDHADIEYNTKKDGMLKVPQAKLTIFGATVPGKLRSNLSLASLTDGFAQRFAWVFATPAGTKRPPVPSFPGKKDIKERWARMSEKLTLHPVYYVDEVGYAAYCEAFDMIMERSGTEDIPESFSGRLVMLAFKYAAIYHVLLGKTDNVLHAEDMIYAARVVALNFRDLRKVLDLYQVTQFGDLAQRSKDKVLANAKKKKQTGQRDLMQGVRGFNTAEQAFQMIEYLAADPQCAPHLDLTPPRAMRKKPQRSPGMFTGENLLTEP
jgi:hypothetical protein